MSHTPLYRDTHVLISGLSVTLTGAPIPPPTASPVTYLLAQASLAQAADLVLDTYDTPLIHTDILFRTCTPPPLGSTPPSFPELPLIR